MTWTPTEDQLKAAVDAAHRHNKGFDAIHHVYKDNQLEKMAVIRADSDYVDELMFDGSPRYERII